MATLVDVVKLTVLSRWALHPMTRTHVCLPLPNWVCSNTLFKVICSSPATPHSMRRHSILLLLEEHALQLLTPLSCMSRP